MFQVSFRSAMMPLFFWIKRKLLSHFTCMKTAITSRKRILSVF